MAHRRRGHSRRKASSSPSVSLPLRLGFLFAALAALFLAVAPGAQVSQALPSSVAEFQPNHPDKFGGRSTAVDIDPSNPNTVIAATESGGLWRSTDSGSNWAHIDTLIPFRVQDVKYAPNNASLIIVTTWATTDSQNPGGIYRSTDGGFSWQRPPSASFSTCKSGDYGAWGIAFEPSTTNIYVGTDCGLATSFDAGATWSLRALARVHAVVAHPNATIDVCADDGHHRFTRSGTTLTVVDGTNAIPTPPSGSAGCPQGNGLPSIHDLAADPGDPQVLFVMQGGSSTSLCGGTMMTPAGVQFLFESDDGGVNWTQIGGACPSRPPWVATHRSRNGNANDFDIYYSGGLDTYRSTCTTNVGGMTQRCTGLPAVGSPNVTTAHADHQGIAFVQASTNCAQFLSSDGGVQISSDCGATFVMAAGSGSANGNFNALQVYEINGQIHPSHTDLYLGTQDNNIIASGDNGATWPNKVCCEGFQFTAPRTSASDAGQTITYVSCFGCSNRKSAAHLTGDTAWVNPTGTNPGADTGAPQLIQGTNSSYLQWTQQSGTTNQLSIATGVPAMASDWTAISGATITQPLMSHAIVTGPPGDPTIYQAFCINSCGFVISTGGLMKITGIFGASATVTNISAGLGTLGTYTTGQGHFLAREPAMGVDPNNPLHLIAADVGSNTMKQSRDGGATWTTDTALTNLVTANGRFGFSNGFFPGTQAHRIFFSPTNGNIILVGTESSGIIASFDNGQTWAQMIGSQAVTGITAFFFDEVQNDILVSSSGRGLWKLTLPTANLSISKSHTPDPATAGTELFYSISVFNSGPDPAPSVVVSDQLPPQVSYVTNSLAPPAGCSAIGQTVTCNLGDIAASSGVTFTIKVAVHANAVSNAGGPISITNTASVFSPGAFDPDFSNNTAVDTVIVQDLADLEVNKLCKPDTNPLATQPINCTVFVDNHGPSDARGVVVDDVMKSSGTFTVSNVSPPLSSGTPGCTLSTVTGGQQLTCRLGTVAAASTTNPGRATITYTISVTEGQDINNVATVRSDTPDPNAANNQAVVTLSVQSVADLFLIKFAAASVVAGTNLTYSLTVQNNGPSTATNVVVQDNLPAEVVVVSVSSGGAVLFCNAGVPGDPFQPTTCNFGTMAPATSRTMTIVVTVKPDVLGPIHNNARASSDTFDADTSDNLASVTTTITAQADLSVTKAATPNPVVAGTPLSYQITVSNAGPSKSDAITLTDPLAAVLSLTSTAVSGGAGGSCGLQTNTNTVQCQLGGLDPSQSVVVFIYTNVSSSAPDGSVITNTATVSSPTPDPGPGPNSATVNTNVIARADLAITLTSDKDVYKPSTVIHYTITVVNGGPSDAQSVVVTQVLPGPKVGFYISNNVGCPFPFSGTFTCNLGTIAAGASKTFQLNFFVRGNKGTITQTATVSSSTVDPNPANNSSTRVVTFK